MSAERPQSREELEAHLAEQVQFLEASAASFDAGFEGEAKRLALTIRVLVHDKGRSRSLLGQLGMKGGVFFDTSTDMGRDSHLAQHPLVGFVHAPEELPRYIALLDLVSPRDVREVDFETWWNGVVFVDQSGRKMTRSGLVLSVAEQDGGAHVDPALNAAYAALSRENSLGWVAGGPGREEIPLASPHLATVRQIAHELLKAIKPGYRKEPAAEGTIIMGVWAQGGGGWRVGAFGQGEGMILSQPLPTRRPRSVGVNPAMRVDSPGRASARPHRPQPPAPVPAVGRNDPCPCGSGKKFKNCHGRSNRIGPDA